EFLRTGGLSAATSALATTGLETLAEAAAVQQPPAVAGQGPAPLKITLNVNGRNMNTSVEPRVTLLDALRNYLDVTGCKRVCDRGTCGACTVLVDGKRIYSCTMLALEAQDRRITTAEALAEVPAAFVEADAQQCGF